MLVTTDNNVNLFNLSNSADIYRTTVLSVTAGANNIAVQNAAAADYDNSISFKDMLEFMIENNASSRDIERLLKNQANVNALQIFSAQNTTQQTNGLSSLTPQTNTVAYSKEMDLNLDGKVTYKEYAQFLADYANNPTNNLFSAYNGYTNTSQALYGLVDVFI